MFLLESKSLDAAYHFAVEDYLLHRPEINEPILYLWQTSATAMIGQYQLVEAEVDLKRASESKVSIVRRPSGGGCIYTDEDTLLLSLILPTQQDAAGSAVCHPQKLARQAFIDLLIPALHELGIPANAEGRNDILLAGKKISGMAQHTYRGRSCTHGSLLIDTDLESLAQLLRVDDEKFRSKAVKSVRSRVTNVKDYARQHNLSCADDTAAEFVHALKSTLVRKLALKPLILNAEGEHAVRQIQLKKYANPDWLRKKSPRFTTFDSKRFDAGKVEVFFEIAKGKVLDCSIYGDFLGTEPVAELELFFVGLYYQRGDFAEMLGKLEKKGSLQAYLGGISAEEFLSCVFD